MAMSIEEIQYEIDHAGDMWTDTDKRFREGLINKFSADSLKEHYHSEAQRYRAKLGYDGGDDGTQFIYIDNPSPSGSVEEVILPAETAYPQESSRQLNFPEFTESQNVQYGGNSGNVTTTTPAKSSLNPIWLVGLAFVFLVIGR